MKHKGKRGVGEDKNVRKHNKRSLGSPSLNRSIREADAERNIATWWPCRETHPVVTVALRLLWKRENRILGEWQMETFNKTAKSNSSLLTTMAKL